MLAYYLPERVGSTMTIRELNSGTDAAFELWELPKTGYLLVETKTRSIVEYSGDAISPLTAYPGHDAAYLGMGKYVVELAGGNAVNALSGEARPRMESRRVSEASHEVAEKVAANDQLSLTNQNRAAMMKVPPSVGTNVNFRIPSYGYITGCTVLANSTGRCGWVAATIVMRYWHARTGKLLIPTAHRSGNNIKVVARPDFADLIRNGRSESVFSGFAPQCLR